MADDAGKNTPPTLPRITEDRAKKLLELGKEGQRWLATYRRFGSFTQSAFEPKISDSEIVVCFADVRGFTHYCKSLQQQMQDRKIQNFLKTHGSIYMDGLLRWYVAAEDIIEPATFRVLRDLMAPTTYKNLGDGLMLVWEIPRNLETSEQSILVTTIMKIVDSIEAVFYDRFRNLTPAETEAYSSEVESLDIGFGMAKGHAWRLDYGSSVDYAGSLVNLAARLQDRARPRGQVIHFDVASWFLDKRATKDGDGKILTIRGIRGYDDVKVWASKEVSEGAS